MRIGIQLVALLAAIALTVWVEQSTGAKGAMVYLAGVIGLCVGSFLNVVAYRWPKAEGEIYKKSAQLELGLESDPSVNQLSPFRAVCGGRSHCPNCNKTLKWMELLPVVSWIWLKGECRGCGESISARYPVVELLVGVVTATTIATLGCTIEAYLAVAAVWFGAAAAIVDFDHLYLPPFFTQGLVLAVGLSALVSPNAPELSSALAGALGAYFLVGRVLPFTFYLVTKRDGLGQGDAILFGLLGAVYGLESVHIGLLVCCFLGLMTYAGTKVSQVAQGELVPGPFAFGPAIIAVTVAGLIY